MAPGSPPNSLPPLTPPAPLSPPDSPRSGSTPRGGAIRFGFPPAPLEASSASRATLRSRAASSGSRQYRFIDTTIFGCTIPLKIRLPPAEGDPDQESPNALIRDCFAEPEEETQQARAEAHEQRLQAQAKLGKLLEFVVVDAMQRHPALRHAAEELTKGTPAAEKVFHLMRHLSFRPNGQITFKIPTQRPDTGIPARAPGEFSVDHGERLSSEENSREAAKIGGWESDHARIPASEDSSHIFNVLRSQWAKTAGIQDQAALKRPTLLTETWKAWLTSAEDDSERTIDSIFQEIFRGLPRERGSISFASSEGSSSDVTGDGVAEFRVDPAVAEFRVDPAAAEFGVDPATPPAVFTPDSSLQPPHSPTPPGSPTGSPLGGGVHPTSAPPGPPPSSSSHS